MSTACSPASLRKFQVKNSRRSSWREFRAVRREGICADGYTVKMFSPTVLDHFRNPRNAGDLPDATAVVEVTNPVCGDVLRLAARVEGGVIVEVGFKTQGCVAAIASSSMLTEMIRGRGLEEVRAIGSEEISSALGGLPPATRHAAQLAAEALRALLMHLETA